MLPKETRLSDLVLMGAPGIIGPTCDPPASVLGLWPLLTMGEAALRHCPGSGLCGLTQGPWREGAELPGSQKRGDKDDEEGMKSPSVWAERPFPGAAG